jgi:GT2 family glycosyltransferase
MSVVIPTYNRSSALSATVASVVRSDLGDGTAFEVVIVDDGSIEPVAEVLTGLEPPPGCTIRIVRQENRGVGAARNRGYREAVGDVVVFVDDDMLLQPTTLERHRQAHHRCPGSVIYGRSPYVDQPALDPFVRWVLGLGQDRGPADADGLLRAEIIASGHLSVERTGLLGRLPALYADDMRTPVAEEYELSHRLAVLGVPVYRAPGVVALHNRTIAVDPFLEQQLGHGRGCAEVARLHPECLALAPLQGIIEHHRRRSARRALWAVLGTTPARGVLRRVARAGQRGRLGPFAPVAFRLAAGAWFSAGVRYRSGGCR